MARTRARGFTLLELAVALFLLSLIFGSLFLPLQAQLQARKTEETDRILDRARDALLGYAAANGYFPCPADATSNGSEPSATNHVTGSCPASHGYLPAAVLGFKPADAQGYAVDAWGSSSNRIRYAVSDQALGGLANALTRVGGLRSIPLGSLGNTPLFHICHSGHGVNAMDCGSALTLASNAVVVVWSVGPNGASGGSSAHESQNPHPNGGSADRVFVARAPSNVPGNEFDDVVSWIPATALASRIVLSGQFTPAAQTVVSPP
jgi:prepilin-type N-terminal cleavage/methylation domain-containing protein